MNKDNSHKGRGRAALRATAAAVLLSLCHACTAESESPASGWERQLFNSDWLYLEDESSRPPQLPPARADWQAVELPHTWNSTDTVDATPGYRRAASWYARRFHADRDSRYVVHFEAANLKAQIYVNGEKVEEHIGGYVGFDVELTEALKRDQPNLLMVRVSNEYDRNLIPSQKSDFFIHGGLTRDVWLHRLPRTFIRKLDIDTPRVDRDSAETRVRLSIDDGDKAGEALTAEIQLADSEGRPVSSASANIAPGEKSATVALPEIENPALWSPDSPQLYTVTATLRGRDGKIIHRAREKFGYRWFEMRPGRGFFLNGERLLIRGTHRHEEHAGTGAAMSNTMHRRDMEQIKAMGANFVRLGHYPQDPEIYRAADELGLILWDELPWCRGGKGGDQWEANTERLLREQIAQNRNHPSIVFWSLGNEIYWESDFSGGGEDAVILPYLKKLNAIAKKLDPQRLTSIRKYYPGADLVDAFSPSIWAGWYGGAYGQYRAALDSAMEDYPRFLHMEYGGSSHRGRHTENPLDQNGLPEAQVSVTEAMNQAVVKSIAKDSDWNENYIVNLFDWHLSVSESMDNFAGNAQWAFKDFGTPLRPENPVPYINQKGLVDRAGNPKDAYYVFASYWSETPFCYIESHTWTVRFGPEEGRPVKVYCNTDSAELFLNGDSLGSKRRHRGAFPAHGLVWQVPFAEGENRLLVRGTNEEDGRLVEDSMMLQYHIGEPEGVDRVLLTSERLPDGGYLITAEAQDTRGRRAIAFSDRGYFSVLNGSVLNGGGRLLENQGTYRGSSTIEMASGLAQIEFTPGDSPSVVEFRTQNIKGVYITLPAAGE